jgi:hypothetical protein
MTRALLTLAALAAALLLAACGGEPTGSADSGNGPDAKTRKAMLALAQCLREHGVDAPDPKFGDDGGVTMRVRGGGSPEKMRAAQQACAKYQRQIKPPNMTAEEKAAFKQAALANARCLREHGLDVPDPTFGDDGSVQMRIGKKGERPDEAKLRAAQEACRKTAPVMGGDGGKP